MLAAALLAALGLQLVQTESKLDDFAPRGTVVWVGAHADDESLVAGAFLAELSRRGYSVVVITITSGSSTGLVGGEYNAEAALVRRLESQDACKVYEAQGCITLGFPQLAHYTDLTESEWKESAHEVLEQWRQLGMVHDLSALMDALRPVLVITLDPDHGMYGHPEHMAVGQAVVEVASARGLRVVAAENEFHSIVGENVDPGPISWVFPGINSCGNETCWQTGYKAVSAYVSQKLPRLDLVPADEQATFLRDLSHRHRAAE